MPDKKKSKDEGKKDTKKIKIDQSESFNYDPVHFIRSHSKNNDPADVQTQIWEVVFEPDPLDNSKTLSNVATCGGNSICIIDVNSGTVLMKYKHKDNRENFYTLAWTTMELAGEKTNILASGGIKGEIRMFHPSAKVCFNEWRPIEKKNTAVNSLVFHSSNPRWLFCGTNDGYVSLYDVGVPSLPTYETGDPQSILKLFPDYGDVYNLAWSGHDSKWLFAGTAAGLVGWRIEEEPANKLRKSYRPIMVDFLLPVNERDKGENPIVDSIAIAGEYSIVAKCANHGLIYMFDLKKTIKDVALDDDKGKNANNIIEQEVFLLANLKWSDTDNFYMNLGCHKGKGLVVCGDDKGSLWLYNIPGLTKTGADPIKKIIEPTTRLMWPELQDDHLENSRKVPLDRHDIIIDKVTVSADSNHIVAVTSNNMVCIWKRTDDDSSCSDS